MLVQILEDHGFTRAWRKGDVCEVINTNPEPHPHVWFYKVQLPKGRKFNGKGLSSVAYLRKDQIREVDEEW